MACKGICEYKKAKYTPRKSPYLEGLRYCRWCQKYLNTGRICFCCGHVTRSKPKRKIDKRWFMLRHQASQPQYQVSL